MEIAVQPVSKSGESNAIWAYTRKDSIYEILHLISLLNTDNEWQDERGKKEKPAYAENLEVKYYTDSTISQVYAASFSENDGMSMELAFQKRTDENGSYVQFSVPSLEYWDMVYMK